LEGESQFDATLRQMSMLGGLRRSNVRHLLIVSEHDPVPPGELLNLLDPQFHPFITVVSNTQEGYQRTLAWAESASGSPPTLLVRKSAIDFAAQIVERYYSTYPADTILVRVKRQDGTTSLVDLTTIDDAERPILINYDLLQERDLANITPEELTEEEFTSFFDGSSASWRPFAAHVPWLRDQEVQHSLERLLRRVDSIGPTENKIAYIASEPGAGGTTILRQLAWEVARAGYVTLVAKGVPFSPDALPMVNFLTRVHQTIDATNDLQADGAERRLYETPTVIVFDRSHWEQREGDLRRFLTELERSGRPAIVLVVTGPVKPVAFYSETIAVEIAALTHLIEVDDALQLGVHLNTFLKVFGKAKSSDDWMRFYHQHSVKYIGSNAAFWIALSFWLRGSQDLTGSIQDWIYKAFNSYAGSTAMKSALVEIAALSSERQSLNEGFPKGCFKNWLERTLRRSPANQIQTGERTLSSVVTGSVNSIGWFTAKLPWLIFWVSFQ
jgi:hypothetical protein